MNGNVETLAHMKKNGPKRIFAFGSAGWLGHWTDSSQNIRSVSGVGPDRAMGDGIQHLVITKVGSGGRHCGRRHRCEVETYRTRSVASMPDAVDPVVASVHRVSRRCAAIKAE